MQAVQFDRFGAAGVLQPRQVPVPVPRSDEVLVRLEWAAVNHAKVWLTEDGGTLALMQD